MRRFRVRAFACTIAYIMALHECDICGASFQRPSRVIVHKRIHTGERPFKCSHDGCSSSYTRPAHLKRHVFNVHVKAAKETFECDPCGKIYETLQGLQKHKKQYHLQGVTLYKCTREDCSEVFKKHNQLERHIANHDGNSVLHKCDAPGCSREFTLPSKLKDHQRSHLEKHYKCEKCEFECNKWSIMRLHLAKQHTKGYACPKCKEVFPAKKLRAQHVRSEHGAGSAARHKCPEADCPRSYTTAYNLHQHLLAVHGGRRWRCPHESCERTFAHKVSLEKHERLHCSPRIPKAKKHRTAVKKSTIPERVAGLVFERTKEAAALAVKDQTDSADEETPSNEMEKHASEASKRLSGNTCLYDVGTCDGQVGGGPKLDAHQRGFESGLQGIAVDNTAKVILTPLESSSEKSGCGTTNARVSGEVTVPCEGKKGSITNVAQDTTGAKPADGSCEKGTEVITLARDVCKSAVGSGTVSSSDDQNITLVSGSHSYILHVPSLRTDAQGMAADSCSENNCTDTANSADENITSLAKQPPCVSA